jgi:hypothetical protein
MCIWYGWGRYDMDYGSGYSWKEEQRRRDEDMHALRGVVSRARLMLILISCFNVVIRACGT